MADNFFDQFDEEIDGNFFDQFDGPSQPVEAQAAPAEPQTPTPAEQAPAGIQQRDPKDHPQNPDITAVGNIARGAGERAMSLLGDLAGFAATTGQNLENDYQLGGLVWDKGDIIPKYLNGDEWKQWQTAQKGVTTNILRKGQEALKGVDLDYEPGTTWENVKESESAWELAKNVAGFAIEQGLVSVPDMAAMVANLPAYLSARTEEIAQSRAESDGRDTPNPTDVAVGAGASTVVTALDRFGLEKLLAPFKGLTGSATKKVATATAVEGATEATQEVIEYGAESIGTKTGFDPATAKDRAAAAAVGGAGFGAAVSGTGVGVDAARKKLAQRGGAQFDQQQPGSQFDPTHKAGGGVDVQQATRNGQPIQDTYIDRSGRVFRDPNAVQMPAAPKVDINGQSLDADANMASAKAEIVGDTTTAESRQQIINDLTGATSPDLVNHARAVETPMGERNQAIIDQTPEITGGIVNRVAMGDRRQEPVIVGIDEDGAPIYSQPSLTAEEVAQQQAAAQSVTAIAEPAAAVAETVATVAEAPQDRRAAIPEPVGIDEDGAPIYAAPELTEDEKAQQEASQVASGLDIAVEAHEAATSQNNALAEPTDAQKEAGNYKKGHVAVQGMDLSIENPAGSKRRPEWPTLKQHYGYIRGSVGADSTPGAKPHEIEQVDAFVKPNVDISPDNPIYIIDQYDAKGQAFDEHKVMLGFDSEQEAREAYLANYTKGWKGLKYITKASPDEFKQWLKNGDSQIEYSNEPNREIEEAPDYTIKSGTFAFKELTDEDGNVLEGTGNLAEKPESEIFPMPPEGKLFASKLAGDEMLTPDEAAARQESWIQAVKDIAENEDHSHEVILSLFDLSGHWSKPWKEAGYQVIQYDIMQGQDLVQHPPFDNIDALLSAGYKIKGILAAVPCTSFAASGARWWGSQHDNPSKEWVEKKYGAFAAEYFDSPLEYAEMLVETTKAVISAADPDFHVLENPVGRIADIGNLPMEKKGKQPAKAVPTLSFQPSDFGDPYTKETWLFGDFNPHLPTAKVEATEGSKMQSKLSSRQKYERSLTPMGFSYAFFLGQHQHAIPAEAQSMKQRLERVADTYVETERAKRGESVSPVSATKPEKTVREGAVPAKYDALIESRRKAEKPAEPAQEPESKPDQEQDVFSGFLSENNMIAGRQRATLERETEWEGGKITRKKLVEKLVDDGMTIRLDGNGKRTMGELYNEARLTKTAMDYAEHLLAQRGTDVPRGTTVEQPAEQPREKWVTVGVNYEGNDVQQDQNGVRAYVESGIRVSQSVGIIPGGGIEFADLDTLYTRADHRFLTEQEWRDRLPPEPKKPAEPPRPAVPLPDDPAFSYEVIEDERGDYVRVHIDRELVDAQAPNFGYPELEKSIPDGDPLLVETQARYTIAGTQHPELRPGHADYLPDRKEMHERWINGSLDHGEIAPDGTKPLAILMGGGGASGKGSVLRYLQENGVIPRSGFVHVDPDAIKEQIPEYDEIQQAGDYRAAATTHEESSDVSEIIIRRAMDQRKHLIIDKTMGDQDKGLGYIERLKENGYEVQLVGVTVDIDEALIRALERYYHTGRLPYVPAMLSAHKGFNAAYEAYAQAADKTYLFDNGTTPEKIAYSVMGDVAIRNKKLYNLVGLRGSLSGDEKTLAEIRERTHESGPDAGQARPAEVRENGAGTAGPGGQEVQGQATDADRERLTDEGPEIQELGTERAAPTATDEVVQPEPGRDQPDRADVAAEQPADVREAAIPRADTSTGSGATGQDVAGNGRAGTDTGPDRGTESGDGQLADAGTGAGGPAGAGAADGTGRSDKSPTGPNTTGSSRVANHFHADNPLEIVGGGQVARFEKNVKAIELYQELVADDRLPTDEEKKVLAGYTGWGSFGQELFQGNWNWARPKQGWEKRDAWLRDHLGKSEWESAQRSITNSHYTDPPTVMAMWDMVRRMGFKGGRVLEPGMGIGNFFAMMPRDLKDRSDLVGIELDEMTGGIAKMLYPDANISIKGYQDSKTPDNFYDLVIGNWPFENTVMADRRYNKVKPFLHDYFFLKAIDQVRPGGVVAGITSKGTLDKMDRAVRHELSLKAELVAAFRLPTGAFKEYAGTDVVTDIVILKKRQEPLGITDESWIESKLWKVRGSDDQPNVNAHFHEHPEHVIGTIGWGDKTTYNRPGLVVKRPPNMQERLDEIVEMVPEGAYEPRGNTKHVSYITNHTDDRQGAVVQQDGGFYIVQGEQLAAAEDVRPYKVKSEAESKKREDQLTRLIDMRGKYAALIEAEYGTESDPEPARGELKTAYDSYLGDHGPLNDSFGLNYLKRVNDPFYPALAALEYNTGSRDAPTWSPAGILSESTVRRRRSMENPSIKDAFVLARNQSVTPTLDEIADLAGETPDAVLSTLLDAGAVFETGDGDIVPHDVYLSGNVREKLRQARALYDEGHPELERNIKALEKVIPKDIPYHKIEARMGAAWIDNDTYVDYIAHMLNLNEQEKQAVSVSYIAGRWKVDMPSMFNKKPEALAGYGHSSVRFKNMVNHAISNQTMTVRSYDRNARKEVVDEQATKEVGERIAKIRDDFAEWVWSDPERRIRLEREYNDARNSWAEPEYDGTFLEMAGMALTRGDRPLNLRKHQLDAIWRAIVNHKSLNAHEVGTGKTMTIGGIAIESRRYGIAKKPLVLAHNANSASVAAGIQSMYPGAKVLYIDNLTPDTIKTKMRQIANDDWDAVVMPHSLIDRLALREDTLMAMAQEEIIALEQEAQEAAKEDGVEITPEMLDGDEKELGKLRSTTAKELVKQRNRIIQKIKKDAQKSSREDAIPFEELGIDMILVDEVHVFKKPSIVTKMRMKGLNTQVSSRSLALQYLTRYVRANNGGGNIHLFTGTPITNTLTEIYHHMRYIMEEEMKEVDLDYWDGWFGSFASELTDVELNAAAEYENVTRLAAFINVPELRKMIGQYMDVVLADDMPEMQPRRTPSGKTIDDPTLTDSERAYLENGRTEKAHDRPYKKIINDTADMTPGQEREFEQIQRYAQSWRQMGGKARMEAMRSGAPESPIITEGLAAKASFDVRLVDGERYAGKEGQIEDHPDSKASRVVRNVLEVHKSHEKATQVIFTELGMSTRVTRTAGRGADGKKKTKSFKVFSTVRDIVERLVDGGIPREQIAVVSGNVSKEKRKEIADRMNKAEIRVVIGSTQTLGTGVNMQHNLRAMHHLDAPWMPGDLEQRNGRGHRQKNQWNTVLEYRYITDRLDGRRWQVLAVKDRFIREFLTANDETRVIEGESASEEQNDILQTFSDASGDPRVLIREKLKKKIERLQSKERMHSYAVADAIHKGKQLNERVNTYTGMIGGVQDVAKQLSDALEANAGEAFSAKITGKPYETRKGADKVLAKLASDANPDLRYKGPPVAIGTIMGLDAFVEYRTFQDTPSMYVKVGDEKIGGEKPSVQSLAAAMRAYIKKPEQIEQDIADAKRSAARMVEISKEPFNQAQQLKDTEKELADLEADMAANPVPPPAWLRQGAPVDTEIFVDGKRRIVTGHRWNSDGWFVLTDGGQVPYMQVKDKQGINVYEEHEFKAPEVIEKPAKEDQATGTSQEKPQLSARSTSVTGKPAGVTRETAQTVIDSFLSGLNGNPATLRFEYRPTKVDAFGQEITDAMRRDGQTHIKGAYYPESRVVLLIGEDLESAADVLETLRHEVIAHFGLNLFDADQKRVILDKVIASRGNTSKVMRDLWASIDRTYPNESEDMKAEEVLARVAESKQARLAKWWNDLLVLVRRFMKKLGLIDDVVGKPELQALVNTLTDAIKQGKKQRNFPADSPQMSAISGPVQPLTKARFYREYAQHIDIRGKRDGTAAANAVSILRDGFKKGINVNALPPYLGGEPLNIVQRKFAPKVGDFVYLAPKGAWKDTPNGMSIQDGWMPKPYEVIEITSDNPSMYDEYLAAVDRYNRDQGPRFRRGDDPVEGRFGMPEETRTQAFVRLFQNAFNRVEQLQETIIDRGGTVRPESDVYLAEELSSGRTTARLIELDRRYMKPLLEIMDTEQITLKELDDFLQARHAPERNDYIASINEDMQDGGSGMTYAQASEIMAEFMFSDKMTALEQAAEIIYAVNRKHMADLVAAGHIEQDLADEWAARWDYYVPLKGKEGAEPAGSGRGVGQGYSISGSGVKSAMGRGAGNMAESPTAHAFAQAESTIVRAEKTKVGQALVNLIRENPDPDFWTVNRRTLKRFTDIYGEPFEGYDEAPEGMVEGLDYHRVKAVSEAERRAAKAEDRKPVAKVKYMLDPAYRQRDDVFAVMLEGKELLINIKDPIVAEQLKRLNASQFNKIVQYAGTINRYLAMMSTAMNPEFVITNFERDLQTALIHLSGEQTNAIAWRVFKSIPGAARGIWQSTFETTGQSEWRRAYEEMQREGGTIGFFGLEDIDTKIKHIQSRLKNRQSAFGKGVKAVETLRDVVLDANLAVENSARLAAYVAVRDELVANGMPAQQAKQKAASVAKNLTVNFNRKGEVGPVLNAFYLFFNASIQGAARIILSVVKSKRTRQIVTGVMVMGFLQAMFNRMFGGDDDDEIPKWDKISDYTKQTHMIFMWPGQDEPVKFKMPYGYNVFHYTGTVLHDLIFDTKKTTMGSAMSWLNAVMNSYNPIQGADFLDTITPTWLKPYEQSERNINFMGAPVMPEYPFDQYDRPDSQKFWKSTNPELVEFMRVLNSATGGDETHPGMIDVSPETVNHYVRWFFGGAGATVTRTTGTLTNLATGEPIDTRNVPFLRTLFVSDSAYYDTERFYEAVKQVAAVEAQLKLYKGTEDYGAYLSDNKEVHKLAVHVPKYKRKISDLKDKRDKAYADRDTDLARDYREQIRREMMEFSKRYDDALEAQQ